MERVDHSDKRSGEATDEDAFKNQEREFIE